MSIMAEYLSQSMSVPDMQKELTRLIHEYNKLTESYLFVYSAAIGKPIPDLGINQSDYYVIADLLKSKSGLSRLDFYIETPGGSGQTAEEIVRFLRDNFTQIYFIVSGEAKSAGTIMVLSGDEIFLTDTGSLGPIDAQVPLGRSVVSAYDYMEWVEEKRTEASINSKLNPFDAVMVAQITPGELVGVNNSLKFAEDLVVEWLSKYKFINWTVTETRQIPVTDDYRKFRAKQIAQVLCNHTKWRLHGRSIKINDLEEIGLKIHRIDNDPALSNIVYRIHLILRLIYDSSPIYKVLATEQGKIVRSASKIDKNGIPNTAKPTVVEISQICTKCNTNHKIYAKLVNDLNIDKEMVKKGFIPFPTNGIMRCSCDNLIDLSEIKKDIESKLGNIII